MIEKINELRNDRGAFFKEIMKSHSPALDFGKHPDFLSHFQACQRRFRSGEKEVRFGEPVDIGKLRDDRHPGVILVPRDRYVQVTDSGKRINPNGITEFNFSSSDFYVDTRKRKIFSEFQDDPKFKRLGNLSQLAFLTPLVQSGGLENNGLELNFPELPHTRFSHSWPVPILAEVTLARNNFSEEERNQIILTFGSHDLAMPCGGESIIRADKKSLGEENNYSYLMKQSGLADNWKYGYNFDLKQAQAIVNNQGEMGKLLDILDKICYVGADCYYFALYNEGAIRNLLEKNPLVFDLWKGIRFTDNKDKFYFTNPDQLYIFTLLRAYEHRDFLLNPECRFFDLLVTKYVRELLEKGALTKDKLLTKDDRWLWKILSEHYPNEFKINQDTQLPQFTKLTSTAPPFQVKKFKTKEEAKNFSTSLGENHIFSEHIKGFDMGLHFPVISPEGKIVKLESALKEEEIGLLSSIQDATKGYYVYFK